MTSSNQIIEVEEQKQLPVSAEATHMRLIQMAVEQGADIEKLERLMDLQDRYEAKEARKAYFSSFSSFQSEMPEVKKTGRVGYENKDGTYTGYTHATLADIGRAAAPLLKKNGLSYRFKQLAKEDFKDQSITLVCIVSHELGHEESTQMTAFADNSGKKNAIQAVASTLTYMQRYTLTAALGLTFVEEDQDGAGHECVQQEEIVDIYPDEDFNKNFPAWKKKIESGNKTAEQMLAILQSKKVMISQEQYEKLQAVEVK